MLIIITGILPVVLYWIFIGKAPSVSADQARIMLNNPQNNALLLDIRTPDQYAFGHLDGALNWPYEDIKKIMSHDQILPIFRDNTALLICNSGLSSALAAGKLQKLNMKVYSVQGGIEEWISATGISCLSAFCKIKNAAGVMQAFPNREMSLFEQWMASITAFGIKPVYMLLSLILIIVLWRFKEPDLMAMRWAMISFLVGEGFCAVNYLFFHENAILVEYIHISGMVMTFGFTTYAFLAGFDKRVLKITDPDKKCAFIDICGQCIKYKDVPCQLRSVSLVVLPIVIILAFIPLLVNLHSEFYNVSILRTQYTYSHPVIFQIFETRYAPAVAIFCFFIAFFIALRSRETFPQFMKVFFSVGMGFLGFSLLRLFLFSLYRDNLWWYVMGEEITELLFLITVCTLLLLFRHSLLDGKSARTILKNEKNN